MWLIQKVNGHGTVHGSGVDVAVAYNLSYFFGRRTFSAGRVPIDGNDDLPHGSAIL